MTELQIWMVLFFIIAIAYWFFIHRKLQRKNQLMVIICAYSLIIILAWTGNDSWQFALLKTIGFGLMVVFHIEELWNLRKKKEEAGQSDLPGAN